MNNHSSGRFPSLDTVLATLFVVGLAFVSGLTLVIAALPAVA